MGGGKKHLSICIPTYNRADKLDRALGEVYAQAKGMESEIEICVSDNGSTDRTGQTVAKWSGRLPIIYRRNQRNRGFDYNMVAAIRMATARYCWLFGDDDKLLEGAIAMILRDIKSLGKSEVGALYFNIIHNNGTRFCELPATGFKTHSFSDAACPPLNLLSMDCVCLNSQIAQSIIREKTYLEGDNVSKREKDRNRFHLFPQVYLFLECVRKNGRLGVEPLPVTRLISDGESTLSYAKKFYLELAAFHYAYDAKTFYPEFKISIYPPSMAGHFLRMSMVCERPELESAHQAANEVFVRLLEMDGRNAEAKIARLSDAVRKLPLMGRLIPISYRAVLFLRGRGNALVNMEEKNPEVAKSLKFLVKSVSQKLKS